jgi:peptidoglycan/LPS O-acetylase OafA/YrhL
MLSVPISRPIQSLFDVLDVWRIICATVVVLSHSGQVGLIPQIGEHLMPVAHHAVIIFFVISGFSVQHSAHRESLQAKQFISARLSRVLSVAVPAILITFALSLLSQSMLGASVDLWQTKRWAVWLLFALSFTGELWFNSIHPFTNIPFWSLNYELYYYLLFAALLVQAKGLRLALAVTIVLVVGPKIIALLPCWWLGVVLHRWVDKQSKAANPPVRNSLLAFVVPSVVFLVLYSLLYVSGLPSAARIATAPYHHALHYSKDFLHDIILAIVFTGCLAWHWRLNQHQSFTIASIVKSFAPLTFAIYALHYPMLKFGAEALPTTTDITMNLLVVVAVYAIAAGIGKLLAPTRHGWRKAIDAILNFRRA